MARWEVEDFGKTTLEKLTPDVQRKIRREMVQNGAKVLVKEMQNEIEARHHVVHRYMKDSVKAGQVYEDVDGTSIEVWPQGDDPRGASNAMKMKIINYGYYNKSSGKNHKKDHFLNETLRKKWAPRIVSVMQYTLSKCMDELDK